MSSPRSASLARRALPALAIAGLSGALLAKLDHPASPAGATSAGADDGPAALRVSADDADDPGDGTAATTTATAVTPRRSTATVPTTATATEPPAAIPTTNPPHAAALACESDPVPGPTVDTKWGPVQVAAVFDAEGTLCDVRVLQYPDDHRKSVSINDRALPILRREALATGTADLHVVSGATITTDAYAASLQAILDGRG